MNAVHDAKSAGNLFLGKTADGNVVSLNLPMANRHGLITGATGTGKTVTLQLMAESFSRAGVPVFTADIKGDLSGLADQSNRPSKVLERLAQLGISDFSPRANPALFWDLFGKSGHPVRTTISEVGPLLLRIGRSIHFPQVANLRCRHCNRTLTGPLVWPKVAEKSFLIPQITAFDLVEEHERTS